MIRTILTALIGLYLVGHFIPTALANGGITVVQASQTARP